MKNIKYIAILILQFSVLQFSFGQATDNNGRLANSTPGAVVQEEAPQANTQNINSESDQDIPGAPAEEPTDYFYPVDMDFMTDDLAASTNPVEIIQNLNELNNLIADLRKTTEELRLENKVIRESLNNCCSNNQLGLSANDAYLIQNAPNPFNATSEIRYFVPGGLEDVEIRICDVKGEVLSSIKVTEAGYGKIEVDSADLTTGTFVYTLSVKGEVIDSKVMIKTANN